MSSSVGLICYSNDTEAADAYYSATPPKLLDGGYSAFEKTSSGWHLNVYQINTDGSTSLTTSTAVTPLLPACDVGQSVLDGSGLAWLCLLPAITAWAIMQMRKVL